MDGSALVGNDLSTHDMANNKDIFSLFSYQTHYTKRTGHNNNYTTNNDLFFFLFFSFYFLLKKMIEKVNMVIFVVVERVFVERHHDIFQFIRQVGFQCIFSESFLKCV